MLFERVKDLAKKRNKNLKQVAEEIGLSENAFYKWKNQSPKAETLQKVADYFGVTTDYLLGRTDTPQFSAKNEREATIEEALNSVMSYDGQPLTDNDREILRGIIEAYLDKKK
ncbi:helix-turn-helix domain-containing protein [Enterococcus faecalis]|uniref:helix-turn-helix domain-containing protein n=1 Tax=Enterococcus faecalis TaxID=1351 RepID=UPI0021E0B198|nr:helix-turn-helix transcriptional regulator [Enterococcus faecalis]MCU9794255.1 helix-turn-helix domain-containing protein [Enterococcus faecalis]